MPCVRLDGQPARRTQPQEAMVLLRGFLAQFEPLQPLMCQKLRCGISWTGRRGAHPALPSQPDPLSSPLSPSPRLSVPGLAPLSLLKVTIWKHRGSGHIPTTLLDSRHCRMDAEF